MGNLDSANWEKYYPTDLLINTSADSIIANSVSDKNYFTLPGNCSWRRCLLAGPLRRSDPLWRLLALRHPEDHLQGRATPALRRRKVRPHQQLHRHLRRYHQHLHQDRPDPCHGRRQQAEVKEPGIFSDLTFAGNFLLPASWSV